jgi:hypothetical protein
LPLTTSVSPSTETSPSKRPCDGGAEHHASDAAEAVDADLDGHGQSPDSKNESDDGNAAPRGCRVRRFS